MTIKIFNNEEIENVDATNIASDPSGNGSDTDSVNCMDIGLLENLNIV